MNVVTGIKAMFFLWFRYYTNLMGRFSDVLHGYERYPFHWGVNIPKHMCRRSVAF